MNMTLTKNFGIFVRSIFLSDANSSLNSLRASNNTGLGNDVIYTIGNLKAVDGTEQNIIRTKYYSSSYGEWQKFWGFLPFTAFNTDNSGYTSFSVGSGNTAATANDYCLSNPINSGVTISFSAVRSSNTSEANLKFSVSVTNSGSDDITIQEIGLNKNVIYEYMRSWGEVRSRKFLFARCVLPSAVVLEPGSTETFIVDIQM